MIAGARYVHTNLVARDWRHLAAFYERVFGCVRVPPERDYSGEALDRGTGLSRARLRGAHLRLPGHGETGPTLEIFQYDALDEAVRAVVNRPGYGHIAFEVDDVERALGELVAAGGEPEGEIVVLETATGATVTWCYCRDPESNLIELQSWGRQVS